MELEAQTKAHVTADPMPLQIILLNRHPGSKVNPHYHLNDNPAQSDTRHQIMICKKGKARIGLFALDGEHVDTVELLPNDLILMTEGHAIEFVDPDTRLIAVKMGPFPKTDTADKVDIAATSYAHPVAATLGVRPSRPPAHTGRRSPAGAPPSAAPRPTRATSRE